MENLLKDQGDVSTDLLFHVVAELRPDEAGLL
jgi:hypothetical protein